GAGLGERRVQQQRVLADALDLRDDELLDVAGRDGLGGAALPAVLLGVHAGVIAITPVALGGVRRRHGAAAGGAMQQALEQGAGLVADGDAAAAAVTAQQRLDALPGGHVDYGRVLALVDLVLVAHLAGVGDVGQQPVEVGLAEGAAAAVPARLV